MKNRIAEHSIGIIVITILMLGVLALLAGTASSEKRQQRAGIETFDHLSITNINDPFERALLLNGMDLYHPGKHELNSALIDDLYRSRESALNKTLTSSYTKKEFSAGDFFSIAGMFVKFFIVLKKHTKCRGRQEEGKKLHMR